MNVEPSFLRVGVDIGGTFTDFVVYNPQDGSLDTFKIPSTPGAPEQAVLAGLARLGNVGRLAVVHGSTVATNALLERKGAATALITTAGFADVVQIGRQNREELYSLQPTALPQIIPPGLRLEVEERIGATGAVLAPLAQGAPETIVGKVQNLGGVESVAVCLLFSFLHPAHEAALAQALRTAGYFVSASHEVLPEFREYERTATTVVNAYVSPVMDRYLALLEAGLDAQNPGSSLRVMQSNGGSISIAEARRQAVRCILSGPAGGVVACSALASPTGQGGWVTFDMGGTSTDVSLIADLQRGPQTTTEAVIGGLPVRIPVMDIHTIGAGGGSVADMDTGGALGVGPQSAGALPGPACYGRTPAGQPLLPTVTDANLALGRLLPGHFLGGQMPLFPELARQALAPLAKKLGLSIEETALGIVAVVNAHMERALRVISVERGHDPRACTLISFGGAGGLHAASLARRVGIPRVMVSPYASTLSALGMLLADVIKDYTQTVMLSGESANAALPAAFAPLLERARGELQAEGVPPNQVHLESLLDVRYTGQSYELTVDFAPGWEETFATTHEKQYGYRANLPLQVVNIRVRGVGRVERPQPAPAAAPRPTGSPLPTLGTYPVTLESGLAEVVCYPGEQLLPGDAFTGPALVVRPDTTVLLHSGDQAFVDFSGNLVIEVGEAKYP